MPMDQGFATLISSLISSLIAAAIGGLSAILSYKMAQKQAQMAHEQIRLMTSENEKNRKYQSFQMALPKRFEAAEILWHLLFQIEHENHLSTEDEYKFIAAQIWLPDNLSSQFIELLINWRRAQRENLKQHSLEQQIKLCRKELIKLVGLENLQV